jgi:hypothetical protein
MDSISLLKGVHKPNQLDAYESIFIRRRQKENIELLNEDDGNVNSRLFDLIFLVTLSAGAGIFNFETSV